MLRIVYYIFAALLLTFLNMTVFPKILPFGVLPNVPLLIGVYLGFTFSGRTDLIVCLAIGYFWDIISGYPFGMHIGLSLFAFIATFWLKTQFLLETTTARLFCLVAANGATLFIFACLLVAFSQSSFAIPSILKLLFPQILINLITGIVLYPLLDRSNRKERLRPLGFRNEF